MGEKKIRFATAEDLTDLIKLCGLHAAFEQSSYDPDGKLERLREILFTHQPSVFCLIAELNGKTVGYAVYMKQYSTWDANFYIYMDCLFLEEAARGMGIGEMLTDRIKSEGATLGCALIQWQTPDFNTRAIKFYKRIGAFSKSKERFFLDIEG